MAVERHRRRFTTTEYHQMAEAGILGENDRLELIDGEIVEMSPIGSRHAHAVTSSTMLFAGALAGRALVGVQNPIQLDPDAEPQPDLTVMRLRSDYRSHLPVAADVLLVVEIADSTVAYDRQVKMPLYARHEIPEYWLADQPGDVLVVYRDPTPDGYRTVRVLRRGDRVSPLAFPDLEVPVDAVLG